MGLTVNLLDPLNPNQPPSTDTISLHGGVSGGAWTADRRLWKTAEGQIVEDGDTDAAFLFAAPGDQVPIEEANKHGLITPEPTPKQAPAAQNKQRRPARDKQAPVTHDHEEGEAQ